MSERYSKLFSAPENLYAEGAPVIVSAGNLLKDNQTGKVLAQLKIKNISAKTVKAAKVLVHTLDTTGKAIDGNAEKEYLDLSVEQGEEFGQKVAIALPNASTRGFSVEVKQIVFTDNSTWEATGKAWEPLPVGESLSNKLSDSELLKQYELQLGGKCDTIFQQHKNLWLCACGTWNSEGMCYSCGKGKLALASLNLDALTVAKNTRLAQEKAEREAKEAAEKEAAKVKAKKAKKAVFITIPIIAFILVAIILANTVFIPNMKYMKAKKLLNEGNYQEAIIAFEAMDGYKDSAEQIILAKDAMNKAQKEHEYAQAERLLAEGDYIGARNAFLKLGDYQDSAQKAQEAVEPLYTQAEKLANEGNLYEAAVAFFEIQEYKDSWQRSFDLWGKITTRKTFDVDSCVIAVCNDGTVRSTGSNFNGSSEVSDWKNIISVSTSGYHTVGLRADGTVVAVGNNDEGQCNVDSWKNIVAVSAGEYHTVGLRMDGTVIGVGRNNRNQHNTNSWKDIIAIEAGGHYTIGLCLDGTVVYCGPDIYGEGNVSNWSNIISISAGDDNNMGLKSDGAVVSAGGPYVSSKDVIAISANCFYTAVLHKDGTVTVVGQFSTHGDRADSLNWKNIVAIGSDLNLVVGLASDGKMVAYGGTIDADDAAIISSWTGIKVP